MFLLRNTVLMGLSKNLNIKGNQLHSVISTCWDLDLREEDDGSVVRVGRQVHRVISTLLLFALKKYHKCFWKEAREYKQGIYIYIYMYIYIPCVFFH